MNETNLITQAVVFGLQDQIELIRNNLAAANANLETARSSLSIQLNNAYTNMFSQITTTQNSIAAQIASALDSIQSTFNNIFSQYAEHINTSYSTAHGGIFVEGSSYRDSGNDEVGQYVVKLNISGIDYFIPASPVATGNCHSQCHSQCHGASSKSC